MAIHLVLAGTYAVSRIYTIIVTSRKKELSRSLYDEKLVTDMWVMDIVI